MAIVKTQLDIEKIIKSVKDIAVRSTDNTDISVLAMAVWVLLEQIKEIRNDSTGIN